MGGDGASLEEQIAQAWAPREGDSTKPVYYADTGDKTLIRHDDDASLLEYRKRVGHERALVKVNAADAILYQQQGWFIFQVEEPTE